MATYPKATLDGVVLEGEVRWTDRVGVVPVAEVIDLRAEAAETLLANRSIRGSTLVIDTGDNVGTWEKLTILREAPSARPDRVGLLVVDLRWFWRDIAVREFFNIRRRSGDRRIVDALPEAIRNVADDITYASWSLKGRKTTWQPREAVEQILSYVGGRIVEETKLGEGQIQDLECVGPWAAAWRAVTAMVPGLQIRLTRSGAVEAYDVLNGREAEIAEDARPRVLGKGWPSKADLRFMRPREVRVYFSRKVALRIDCEEAAGGSSGSTGDASAQVDKRVAYNVLPCPDASLDLLGTTLPDGTVLPARTVTVGTWIPVQEALAKWSTESHPLFGTKYIFDDDHIRHTWFNGQMWRYWAASDVTDDRRWARRVAAIREHYRQTYQIAPKYRRRMLAVEAVQVGVEDYETGSRARSPVYGDYAIALGIKRALQDKDTPLLKNVDGSPISRTDPIDSSGVGPAPCRVEIVDHDLGIFHLDYRVNPYGAESAIVPSLIEDSTANPMPVADLSAKRHTMQYAVLASSHSFATILTVVPAAPTGLAALHREDIRPSDVEAQLGMPLGRCDGEVLDLIVSPEFMYAEFGWQDALAGVVDFVLGADGNEGSSLVRPGEFVNSKAVRDVAIAFASQIYATATDRIEGICSTPFAPYSLDGTVSTLRHTIRRDGKTETTIEFPGDRPALDIYALLPFSTQRLLRRLVTV